MLTKIVFILQNSDNSESRFFLYCSQFFHLTHLPPLKLPNPLNNDYPVLPISPTAKFLPQSYFAAAPGPTITNTTATGDDGLVHNGFAYIEKL
jgi:hypothetical protein